jgi:ribonuclease VapC
VSGSLIVVDSSAIIAILLGEPERTIFIAALDQNSECCCSTVTFVESFMVSMNRRAGFSFEQYTAFMDGFRIKSAPIDEAQGSLAAQAFLRFGKGRHPAKLNLGDCFSYALAKSLNAALLFKGDDFSQTDIVPAIAAGAAGP